MREERTPFILSWNKNQAKRIQNSLCFEAKQFHLFSLKWNSRFQMWNEKGTKWNERKKRSEMKQSDGSKAKWSKANERERTRRIGAKQSKATQFKALIKSKKLIESSFSLLWLTANCTAQIHQIFCIVRYHCGGWPEEVNTCFLNSYMVYL